MWKTVHQGSLGECRRRGRQMKSWKDYVKDIIIDQLLPIAQDRPYWRMISVSSSLIAQKWPDGSRE
ncbi:hypothetical protein DPMN_079321 [Dreissena polymorpha]|uniref:Uncharacterized protein n=1 Tax=Dreissena polymorpha TaxID=45954 RepID=A0A9D4BIA0_DREPO|nr:hypothetical protein DPMN_079321 [Dreissena polymorpha]